MASSTRHIRYVIVVLPDVYDANDVVDVEINEVKIAAKKCIDAVQTSEQGY